MVDFGLRINNAQGLPVIDLESEPLVCLGRYGIKAGEEAFDNRVLYCFPIGTYTQDFYVSLIDYLPHRLYENSGDLRYLASVVVSPNAGGSSVFLFGPLSLALDLGIGKLGTGWYGLEVYGPQGALTYSDNYITLDVLQTVDLADVPYDTYPTKRVPHVDPNWLQYGYCWLSRVKNFYLEPVTHGRTLSHQAPGWYVDRHYTSYQMMEVQNISVSGVRVAKGPVRAYLWKPGATPGYVHHSMIGGVADILAFVRLPSALNQLPVQQVIWQ